MNSEYTAGFRAGQQDMAYQTYAENIAFTEWVDAARKHASRHSLEHLDSMSPERWHE